MALKTAPNSIARNPLTIPASVAAAAECLGQSMNCGRFAKRSGHATTEEARQGHGVGTAAGAALAGDDDAAASFRGDRASKAAKPHT
mmetsp:Transcript_85249/g.260620  ORF Transcript_85249/g.260620 Transcript_85249/m.260620 type:complete len:87 (-) Transcript_85249:893-1153(-)